MCAGCAQIGSPTGGASDTQPPKVVSATPKNLATNVNTRTITIDFDEYITVENLKANFNVQPLQNNAPEVKDNNKRITVILEDTLIPNTTYTIQFGNSISDITENNKLKNYSLVFSTGNSLDSGNLSGNVVLANSGEVDSTLIVMLYKGVDDTLVYTKKPNYITFVNGLGNFSFSHISEGKYLIYALKDADNSQTYNSPNELFAFAAKPVIVSNIDTNINLLAYLDSAAKESIATTTQLKATNDNKKKQTKPTLTVTSFDKVLDITKPQTILLSDSFVIANKKGLQLFDSTSQTQHIDSVVSQKPASLLVYSKWVFGMNYSFMIQDSALILKKDSSLGIKSDTLAFSTMLADSYATLKIRYVNLDTARKPVLILNNGQVDVYHFPIQKLQDTYTLLQPGTYNIKILYDVDGNGKYTTGNYSIKRQPEEVITIPQKLTLRANWESEQEIIF